METGRARMQLMVDTRENWYKTNPILLSGEIGLEKLPISSKSNFAVKIGDGMTEWRLLPYIAFENVGNTLVQSCTQAEYDAMEKHDVKTVYYATDESGNVKQYLGDIELSSGKPAAATASMSLLALCGESICAGYYPENKWNFWQETNNNVKTTATVTATPSADCLLLATVMHRGENVSIDGEEWQKLVTTPTMVDDTTVQYITVWVKRVSKGTYDITVNQDNSARMSLKAIVLYNAESLNVVDNMVIDTFPKIPTTKTVPCRRLYLLSSIYATNVNAISVNSELNDLRKAEEVRFSAFYDYENNNLSVPTFSYNGGGSYHANTANLITIEIK